ncbi:Rap1a/Tai family immunity protein [Granulicella mallensis]|uniref:Rap1a immunity protein domain-containing protein n=1 Tax=Granulicella mallensis TaxID=940614 RepID=A0A7W8EC85_9BACT|nr:Rap1a/Tai family immunity protein [Granulicella mallensis]MBB5066394.1 hypothetical protein [Granulicella mallensis]
MLAPLLMLALSANSPTIPENDRGSYLYRACQGAIRYNDAGSSGTTSDAMQSIRCVSYLSGFLDAMDLAGLKAICANGASMGTVARVYIAYMTAHPKLMDVEIPVGVSESLLDAYPCAVPKK